jgi:putative serine protease PepD
LFDPPTEREPQPEESAWGARLRRAAPLVAGLALGAGATAGVAVALDDDGGGSNTNGAQTTTAASATAAANPTTTTLGRGASNRSGSLTVEELYRQAAPGVVLIQSGADGRGQGLGSGFVIDEEGTIVTNQHVVAGADEVSVRFDDDTEVPARVLGTDPGSDLALLDVELPAEELTPLPLGELAGVEVGEPVVAIGNPFGLERTITSGIVSALGRRIEAPDGFAIDDAIQTDAALNSGNSGGPLLDLGGNVIGVNSQIETRTGGNVGIGYAVPVDTLKDVLDELRQGSDVERAYLGISMEDADEGVVVTTIRPGSPAAAGELRPGDVILRVDGETVDSPEDVARIVSEKEPGDLIELEGRRGNAVLTARVTLAERPS